jgi:uncharacterized protein (TIGR00251 family)
MPAVPWRETPDGVELTVRLVPRGGGARIEGISEHEGRSCLKIRVAAPPVDGAANAALVDFLARTLDIPRSHITLLAGEHARLKRLRVRGPDVLARLAAFVELTNG